MLYISITVVGTERISGILHSINLSSLMLAVKSISFPLPIKQTLQATCKYTDQIPINNIVISILKLK